MLCYDGSCTKRRRQLHDIKVAIDAKVAATRRQSDSYMMPRWQLHDAKVAIDVKVAAACANVVICAKVATA
jgi:hypothetical protein